MQADIHLIEEKNLKIEVTRYISDKGDWYSIRTGQYPSRATLYVSHDQLTELVRKASDAMTGDDLIELIEADDTTAVTA